MIWNMEIGTWLYYFALPWGTFLFTVLYGFYWLTVSDSEEMMK